MSTLDLMEDGFPHGTRAGYQQGCHSKGACMGPLDGLMTCVEANMRYASDFGYRKKVDAGVTPQQIAEADKAAKTASKVQAKPAGVGVEQSVEPVAADLDELLVDEPEVEFIEAVSSSPSSPQHRPGPTEAQLQRMRELHGQSMSDNDIAGVVGLAQSTVSRHLRKMGLSPVGRRGRPKVQEIEPPAAVAEAVQEERADGILAELADERGKVELLRGELDGAHADVSIEKAAREGLALRVADLSEQLDAANEYRAAALQEVSTLRDRVATLLLELDVAKSPDAVPVPSGVELAPVPSAPVAAVEDVAPVPVRVGAVGLDIQQVGDALSVRLHGGEPVHLNLQFSGGALSDVGVKIGA